LVVLTDRAAVARVLDKLHHMADYIIASSHRLNV